MRPIESSSFLSLILQHSLSGQLEKKKNYFLSISTKAIYLKGGLGEPEPKQSTAGPLLPLFLEGSPAIRSPGLN